MLRLLFSNSPIFLPQKYLEFPLLKREKGLEAFSMWCFMLFLPFLPLSTFLRKMISCSYRVGVEKIKMFIYFFCWFPGDYIVIAFLTIYICMYVHLILAVDATTCLSIK